MSLLLSLIGALIYSLLPWAIGQKILKHDPKSGIALKTTTGWIVVFFITLILSLGPGLNANSIIALSLLAVVIFGKTIYLGVRQLSISSIETFRSSSALERLIFILIIALLTLRAFQAFAPSTNWDSLNQHLPLLSARLEQQNLDPVYQLPTDRRTPISGILLKIPIYCFGQDGRSISLTFFGIYLIVIFQIWTLLFRLCSRLSALIAVCCFVSWTDVAIYFKHLGDEAFFCLFVTAITASLLLKLNSHKAHFLVSITMGICCSIKLTALFFIPFLACVYLYRYFRDLKPSIILGSLLCFFIFALAPYLKQKHEHHMIYPLQRWTNLMEFGPQVPKVYDFKTIQSKRAEHGLNNHRDNQKVSSHPFSKWLSNFYHLKYLPLGPYFLWAILMLIFSIFQKVPFSEQKRFNFSTLFISALIVFTCLNLAMIAWDFSPQAITRYLMPLWCIYAIVLGIFFFEFGKSLKIEKNLKFLFLLCLLFSFSLESKQGWQTLKKNPFQNTHAYWLDHCADAKLIEAWKNITQEQQASTFYMGNSSILFMQPQHQVAQVGNEVGWREPKAFLQYLTDHEFKYFVYSFSAETIDPMYRVIKDYCANSKKLALVNSNSNGEIYQILP